MAVTPPKPLHADSWWGEVPTNELRREIQNLYKMWGQWGTWVPILVGQTDYKNDTKYDSNVGRYVKMGPLVYIFAFINISQKGTDTGELQVLGLPFTSEPFMSQSVDLNRVSNLDYTTGYSTVMARVFASSNASAPPPPELDPKGTYINFRESGDNVADRAVSFTQLTNDTQITLTGIYFTTEV